MKIAIIGSTGFVGKATSHAFNLRGIETVGYHVDDDTSATKEEVNKCDMAFVCVPTPMSDDGSCDISIVTEVVDWIETPLIVIKSTIPVFTTRTLCNITKKQIVHSPEFLREKTFLKDAEEPSFVLVGYPYDDIQDIQLEKLMKQVYPTTPIKYTTSEYSELVKYSINAFLAYKVGFFNELHNIASALGIDAEKVTNLMLNDPRIGESHSKVTSEGGFGGHCFPKDLNALIKTSISNDYDPKLLKELWNSNRRYRNEFSSKEYNFYD
jgi:UDPglucose 6-dehydrogenase